MFLSVFDLFKIGIGPSSSHTVGPMVAAARFLETLAASENGAGRSGGRIEVSLHGSLAFTGKGHGTDRAVIAGLGGARPDTVTSDALAEIVDRVTRARAVAVNGMGPVAFDPAADLRFDYGPALDGHPNGLVFRFFRDGEVPDLAEIYYSVGGGFVLTEAELDAAEGTELPQPEFEVPYPFTDAKTMLEMGTASGLSIAAMKRANEEARDPARNLDAGLARIWSVMNGSIERGFIASGRLPGGLDVKRRAGPIHRQLQDEAQANLHQPHRAMDWLSVYAMAVNEENAAGGRIVTAPTNGAAGVIPAVLRYTIDQVVGIDEACVNTFLLVAAAIGGIIKHNASISGAEVGCQGEVGSASAMAAAGLCAVLGGTNAQIENAAEIALEHHLGMTCDPVGGLVQVPCIERNAFGAVKAVNAASLAMRDDGSHLVPLDNCIRTMLETGRDMNTKYKETSTGGLAVNVVAC